MFGFSLTKLLVLVAIILAVLWAFRAAGRRRSSTVKAARAGVGRGLRRQAVDVVECTVCGDFVRPGATSSCQQKECPHRG